MNQWSNYIADSTQTALTKNIHIEPTLLIDRINSLPPNKTLYHCYYDLEPRDSFAKYEGKMKPVFDQIHIDFDSDDGGLSAWEDVKKFSQLLISEGTKHQIYFSGNKGFHVAIHKSTIDISEGTKQELEQKIKFFLSQLKKTFSTVDLAIWNANRKFRAYRSQHEKSGLYKIRIKTHNLTISEIREIAKVQPDQALEVLSVGARSGWLSSIMDAYSPQVTNGETGPGLVSSNIMGMPDPGDDSWRYRNFKGKKCLDEMIEYPKPQFDRHEICLRIIYDLMNTGVKEEKAIEKIVKWAESVFVKSDDDRQKRIEESIRMTKEAYSGKTDLKYGCYDQIKKAHCSAKCGLWKKLDKTKKEYPIDTPKSELKMTEETQVELAKEIVESGLGEFLKRKKDFFRWTGTHWEMLDQQRSEAAFISLIHKKKDFKLNQWEVEGVLRAIISLIPTAPDQNNLYSCGGKLFNYTDGTYEVSQNADGKYNITKHQHTKEHFLGYCSPFPYNGEIPETLPRNGIFLKYMDSKLKTMGEDQVRVLKQMLGTAILPYAPRVFFLTGNSNSGKSTFGLLMQNLVGEQNCSNVCPTTWKDRFAMAPMIGKLANIVLELPKNAIIKDDTIKKLRDKNKETIERKGMEFERVNLPPIQAICCNKLPKSMEGNTGALDNRVTVLDFPDPTDSDLNIPELASYIWKYDSYNVLKVAREGLTDLINSDLKYFVPQSSIDHVKEWQKDSDPVKLWLEEIELGAIKYDKKIPPKTDGNGWELGCGAYDSYKQWSDDNRFSAMSSRRFYGELERLAVPVRRKAEGGTWVWIPENRGSGTSVRVEVAEGALC